MNRVPGIAWLLAAMAIFFSVFGPRFASAPNLINIGTQSSILLLLALPMTLIVMTEGMDLSMGAVLGLSGVVLAMQLVNGVALPFAFAAAVGVVSVLLAKVHGVTIHAHEVLVVVIVPRPAKAGHRRHSDEGAQAYEHLSSHRRSSLSVVGRDSGCPEPLRSSVIAGRNDSDISISKTWQRAFARSKTAIRFWARNTHPTGYAN